MCEACGYALKGLSAEGDCPECGLAITESSPVLRTGPGWQARPGPVAAIHLIAAMIVKPGKFFRHMRVDGSNLPARLFLLIVAGVVGLFWGAASLSLSWMDLTGALFEGLLVGTSVIVLTYIEAAGVAYISWRRRWRVPIRLAERLACYSSIGWLPAAGVMWVAVYLVMQGHIDRWMRGFLPVWEPWQSTASLVLVAAVAMMWFEVLVWLGVRQTKHANF